MGNRILTVLVVFPLLAAALLGQARNEVLGVGFVPPKSTPIAPGQLVTLFVRGLKAGAAKASNLPLPTTLAGVSVSLKQGNMFNGSAPMFRIVPLDSGAVPCGAEAGVLCGLTAITVQIPFEIVPCVGQPTCAGLDVTATVVENGVAGESFTLFPFAGNVHILNRCDIMSRENLTPVPTSCDPLILRPDGTLVTRSNPARAGEGIIVFVVGLGHTLAAVPSGAPSPFPPARAFAEVNLDFRLNVPPGPPSGGALLQPLFAGLTPGFVGLYQVNVKLPDQLPQEARACGPFPLPETNMTLTIRGRHSFDGAQICVQP